MSGNGFDDFSKTLGRLAQNAEELGNVNSIPLAELLTPSFIAEHTQFKSADEFFAAGGLNVGDQKAFEALPPEKFDAFVRSVSSFASWADMRNSAGEQWAKRKLGL